MKSPTIGSSGEIMTRVIIKMLGSILTSAIGLSSATVANQFIESGKTKPIMVEVCIVNPVLETLVNESALSLPSRSRSEDWRS
jgi:hypothetical protein